MKEAQLLALSENYFQRYLNYRERYPRKWVLHPNCKMVIVVPAYQEEPAYLLDSLESCDLKDPNSVSVIWLINQAEADTNRSFHQAQAEQLKSKKLSNGLRLIVESCLGLKPKEAGVGTARKIGMDMALEAFAEIGYDGIILCLDGDCKVSQNYLETNLKMAARRVKGYDLYFEHPLTGLTVSERQGIIDYELWLRYYRRALKWAKYPWHYYTVGSSMAARASIYAKIGGMNRRKAGEDFYFLHKLMPQGSFESVKDCTVYPQARISQRVPFGTGRAMYEIEQGEKNYSESYNHLIFKALNSINESVNLGHQGLMENEIFSGFLSNHPKYSSSFDALIKRSSPLSFKSNFWTWWDGFKVLRMVHDLQSIYPDERITDAAKALWELNLSKEDLLLHFRALDRNGD